MESIKNKEEQQQLLNDDLKQYKATDSKRSKSLEAIEEVRADESSKSDDSSTTNVSFLRLFRFADVWDVLLIIVGSIGAAGSGAAMPILFIFFGNIADVFSAYDRYNLCHFNYSTCFAKNFTFVSEQQWNSTIQIALDSFQEGGLTIIHQFLYAGCLVFLASAVHILCWSLQAKRQVKRLRIAYFKAIIRQDIAFHDSTSAGELSSSLTREIFKIRQGVGEKLSLFVQYVSATIVSLVVALILSWKVALVALAASPLLAISSTLAITISTTYAKKEQAAYAKAGSIAEEAISLIRTVVAFGCQHKEVDRYIDRLGEARGFEIRRGFFSGLVMGVMYLSWMGLYGLCFWYGTTLVIAEEITVGELMIVVFQIIIAAWSAGMALSYFDIVSESIAAGSRVFQVIDRVPAIDVHSEEGVDPTKLSGDLMFDDVHFSYPTRPDAKILKGVWFTVPAGRTVALVGESGAGKSTVVQLLQRFYDVEDGFICLNGENITSFNLRKFRQMIGVVSQEPVLFATTIADNIRWGRDGVTDDEVIEAAKQANIYDFIMKLPQKFETLVGEGGGQMSGGQKQRIAIARAIARNPKILLLDEATSALDTESESIVQAALEKASAGRTTIVIAHRLSTIRNADKIIAVQDGRVIEEGSHDELIKIEDGVYSNLVKIQGKASLNQVDREGTVDSDVNDVSDDIPTASSTKVDEIHELKKDKRKLEEEEEMEVEEPPNISISKILHLNKPEWCYIAVGCLFSLLASCGDPVSAVLIGQTFAIFSTNDSTEQEKKAKLVGLLFLLLGFAAFLGFVVEAALFAKSGVELTLRLRRKALSALLRQDISYFDDPKHSTGALCARLSTDALRVQGCTGIRLGTIVKNLGTLGAALVVAFSGGWQLALLVITFIPFMVLGVMIMVKFLTERIECESAGQISSEAAKHIRTVASLTAEAKMHDLYRKMLKESSRNIFRKSLVLGLAYGYEQCTIFFSYAATFRLGVHFVLTGESNIVLIFRVITAVYFGAIAIGRNSSLAPDYAAATMSARRLFRLFDRVPTIDAYSCKGVTPDHCKGELSFHSVFFSYSLRSSNSVLRNFSFTVKPGQTLALVGQSGSGKSTSVKLLERFYDPQDGVVTLDGVDISKLNIGWLRQQMGLVSQEPVLFDQSIADNIRFGDCTKHSSDSEVEEAAKLANAHHFVAGLPDGYRTNVGTGGGQLSGGQKQRVAIARALLRNPKIILLDEATSALDAESEKVIQSALDAARKGRTSIIIAHRLSTVKNADQIAVIDNGVVAEVGTHDELLASKGAYFRLVNAQVFVNSNR